jgi:hypothetical protein
MDVAELNQLARDFTVHVENDRPEPGQRVVATIVPPASPASLIDTRGTRIAGGQAGSNEIAKLEREVTITRSDFEHLSRLVSVVDAGSSGNVPQPPRTIKTIGLLEAMHAVTTRSAELTPDDGVLLRRLATNAGIDIPGVEGVDVGDVKKKVDELVENLTDGHTDPRPGKEDVEVEVQWVLRDDQGNELATESDYDVDSPPDAQQLKVVLAPPIAELTTATQLDPPIRQRTISARVRLTSLPEGLVARLTRAGAVTGDWVETPEIPIVVPALLVPTAAVLFIDRGYNGRYALFVPGNSPLRDAAGVIGKVQEVNKQVQTLLFMGSSVGFVAGLEMLSNLRGAFSFSIGDEVNDFDEMPDFHDGILGFGVGPDDEASSLLMVAAPDCPHNAIDLFPDEDCEGGRYASE